MLKMWTLVLFGLELEPEIWLALSEFAIQPSISASCLLVELLQCYGSDYKQVKEWEILSLSVELVVGVSF